MADEVASLLVRITADGSQAVGVLQGIEQTVGTLASSNATMMNKIAASGALATKVGTTITKTVGIATVAGLVASAKAAGQLNKELANIGTLSVPTEKLKQYKGQIQDIAVATGKSTSDIAEGTYQVVSAFGDSADTMEKVEINAKAARAGLATTADSIALTSAVTKAYGDTSAGATQKVADLAFKTVELGQTTFPELAQSMQQVTSLSKELGVSQEELFGAYATLTGVTGNAAEVQTQMKAVYTALLKPSENMTKAIRQQGFESGYSMIKTLGFAGTLDALKKATNGSEEEMLGLFNNVRAMPAVMALTGAQYDTFTQKLGKMQEATGAASNAFEVQTEGIAKTGFTLEQAKVKMQVAAQRFGESAAPIIADFAGVVDKAATSIANMSDEERRGIINTGVLTTKIGLGLAVGGKVVTFGTKIASVASAIASVGPAAGIAAAAVSGVAAAAIAGKVAYDNWYDSNYKFADGLREQAQEMNTTRKQWAALNDLRYEYNNLSEKINSNSLEGEELEKSQARLEEIVQILKDQYEINVDSGDIDEAIKKAEELRKITYQQNQHELKEMLDERRPAYDMAVNDRLPKAKREYEEATAAAEQYSEAQKKVQEAQNKFDLIKGSATAEERNNFREKIKDILSETDIPEKLGENWSEQLFAGMNNSQSGAAALAELQRRLDGLNVDKLKEDYEGLDKQVQEYKNIASQYANTLVDDFKEAVKAGASDEDLGNYLRGIKSLVDDGLISMDEYAKKITLAKSGQESVNKVFEQGEDALKQYISSYTDNMRLLGAADSDIAAGLQPILDAYAKFMNLPEGKTFKINADGNLEIIDEATEKIEELPEEHNTDINADDNTDAGTKSATNNINDVPAEHDTDITAEDNTAAGVQSAKSSLDSVPRNIPVTISVTTVGVPSQFSGSNFAKYGNTGGFEPQATGTQNFPGGLAMVNDQRGIADPRELIVDRGRAFIPEGRDVILPLSKGAKVYTAAQTKRIMAGIPHYADGKDNSEGFISARDEWQHYTRTHAVTTARELEKWVELSEEFAENEKDIADIEEKIFDLRVKLNDEMNKTAEEYIEEHNALNDWDTIGDSAVSAFERVRERNLEEVEAQRMTWAEYSKTMKSLGASMYNDRIKQSEKWLEHEERYNGMGSDDYLAGIDRMREYTEDYYARGIISHREYVEAKIDLDEMYFDEYKKKVEKSVAESTEYIQRRAYFNNWEENGDTQLEAYERAMKPLYEALEKYGEGYWDEFVSLKSDIDTAFLDSSNNQSFSWLDEQVKYFGMTSEEYAKGLERVRDTNITWHEKFGIGTEQQLHELTTDINHKLWDEVSSAYDTMLKNQQSYITEMRDKFQEQEQALRDSWEVDDRKASIAELTDNVRLWSGAVTERGREQLKQYEEQLKQAKRDEEIFNLQKNNNATLNALEADYKKLEDAKKKVIAQIASTDVKISSIVDSFAKTVDGQATSVVNLLQTLIERVDNIEIKGGDTMNDNRKQTTTNYNTIYPQVGSIALGEWGILR